MRHSYVLMLILAFALLFPAAYATAGDEDGTRSDGDLETVVSSSDEAVDDSEDTADTGETEGSDAEEIDDSEGIAEEIDDAEDAEIEPSEAYAWRRSGPSVYGGFVAVPGDNIGGAGHGVALQAGWHVEAPHVWLEPRVGWRFSPYTGEDSTEGFMNISFDLIAKYLFIDGPVSPFLMGGAGMHFMSTKWLNDEAPENDPDFGEAIRERGWAAAANLGAGVMLMRTDETRLSIGGEYHLVSIVLRDRSVQHLFTANIGVHF